MEWNWKKEEIFFGKFYTAKILLNNILNFCKIFSKIIFLFSNWTWIFPNFFHIWPYWKSNGDIQKWDISMVNFGICFPILDKIEIRFEFITIPNKSTEYFKSSKTTKINFCQFAFCSLFQIQSRFYNAVDFKTETVVFDMW